MIQSKHPSNWLNENLQHLAIKVLQGESLLASEALSLTTVEGDDLYDLFFWANKIRIQYVGRQVKFCSILASKVGACTEDCSYCAQSKHYKTHVTPAKSSLEEMRLSRDEAAANGASSFGLVNSGRGPTEKELDWMEPFFRETAGDDKIRPCATLGELSKEQAQRLKAMGVERVNHNLETSRQHFDQIVSTHGYEDRLQTIKNAKEAGLSICSGGIFGLGESWHDRIDMALDLRRLGVDVVPVNFLKSIQGTPLYKEQEPLEAMEALKIIAIYRFLLPHAEIKVAGGRETILRELQSWIFFAGASSFLIGNYLTTFGRTAEQDHQLLKDLNIGYHTYDEVERTADPEQIKHILPNSPTMSGPAEGLMSRRKGVNIALPVLGK